MQGNSIIRSLVSDAFVYGITRYLAFLAALILTPYYTSVFSPQEYGVQDFFNVWINFATLFVPLGLVNTTLRWWVDIKDKHHEKRLVLGTNFRLISLLCLAFAGIMLLARPWFEQLFLSGEMSGEIYYLSVYVVVTGVMVSYLQNIQRSKFDKWGYALVSVSQFLILVTGGFVLVRFFDNGIEGFFRAAAAGYTVSLLIALWLVRHEIAWTYDRSTARAVLGYGFSFMLATVMLQVPQLANRYFNINLLDNGLHENGIYSVGKRVADFVLFVSLSFQMIWLPSAMAIKNDPEARKIYSRVHDFYVFALGLCFLAIVIFRNELLHFFAPVEYHAAYDVIFFLALFNVLNGIGPVYTVGIHISKQTRYLSIAAAVSLGVHLAAAYLLTIGFGIEGTAIATFIGAVVWTGLRYYFSQRLFPISFSWSLFILLAILALVFYFLNPKLDESLAGQWMLGIAVKTGFMLVVTMLFLMFYKPSWLSRWMR
jgi:O-antigen/teichoic acid export membrane protein